jgi:tetratricopeptide (TPR) repeat protein
MKKVLKATVIFVVVILAIFLAAKYLNCGLKREYRVSTDKHIKEIRDRIKDIEDDNVSDTESIRRLGEQYSNLGGVYLQKGLWDLAIESYEKSIHYGRSSPGVLYSIGIAYGNRGRERDNSEDVGKSESYLRKAIDLKDNFYEAENALAILLFYHKDEKDEAVSLAKEVVSRNPKYYIGRFTLGRFYYEMGALDKALPVYEDLNADLDKLPKSDIINAYKNQCRENIQRIMGEMTQRKKG